MKLHIAVLPGDGVGPEVTAEAVKALRAIAMEFNHIFTFEQGLIGADAIDKTGEPLPDETLDLCKKADAILFGAIGNPEYDADPNAKIRPEHKHQPGENKKASRAQLFYFLLVLLMVWSYFSILFSRN